MSNQSKLESFVSEFGKRIDEKAASRLLAEVSALLAIAEAAESLFDEQTSLTADRGEKSEVIKLDNDRFYKRAIAAAELKLSEAVVKLNELRSTNQ